MDYLRIAKAAKTGSKVWSVLIWLFPLSAIPYGLLYGRTPFYYVLCFGALAAWGLAMAAFRCRCPLVVLRRWALEKQREQYLLYLNGVADRLDNLEKNMRGQDADTAIAAPVCKTGSPSGS